MKTFLISNASRCERRPRGWRRHTIRMAPFAAATLIFLCLVSPNTPLRAEVSAPDPVVYGTVVIGTNPVLADSTAFSVEARRSNNTPIARYRIGERTAYGSFYVLRLKLEETAPARDPVAALVNESLSIVVLSNGVERARQPFTVLERGQVQRLDFGSHPTNLLSGFELWAVEHGLDPASQSFDADADGVSNFAEFTAGTLPTDAKDRFVLEVTWADYRPRIAFEALRAIGAGYENATRHYALERRPATPMSQWQPVPGFADILGQNQVVMLQPSTSDTPALYRGVVWLSNAGTVSDDFRLQFSPGPGMAAISFLAQGPDSLGRNRYYTLEESPHPAGPWTALPDVTNVLGTGQTISRNLPEGHGAPLFYRARLELR